MSSPDQDEKLWRYLGGQPPSRAFSEKVCSDPEFADRLARLALIECSIREEATATEGQSILKRRRELFLSGVGSFAALVLLTLIGFWIANRPIKEGTPTLVKGSSDFKDLVAEVKAGKTIRVREERFKMGFAGERTELVFDPDTEVRLEEAKGGGKKVVLRSGRLQASIAPQKESFHVTTPHLSVEVVGTAFDVAVTDRVSEVMVGEGIVDVKAKPIKQPLRLKEGSGWYQRQDGRGFSVAIAEYVLDAPVIDEQNDRLWDSQLAKSNQFREGALAESQASGQDHSSSWKAVWNEEALFILIEVSDSEADNHHAKVWARDSVEIFVDADNSRSSKFDGVNDHFLFFEPGSDLITPGIGALEASSEITHHTHRTDSGFRLEVCLPWSALGIQPQKGLRIGFNIASNDSDPGDDARSQLSWTPKSGNDWARPDRMGFLILSSPEND